MGGAVSVATNDAALRAAMDTSSAPRPVLSLPAGCRASPSLDGNGEEAVLCGAKSLQRAFACATATTPLLGCSDAAFLSALTSTSLAPYCCHRACLQCEKTSPGSLVPGGLEATRAAINALRTTRKPRAERRGRGSGRKRSAALLAAIQTFIDGPGKLLCTTATQHAVGGRRLVGTPLSARPLRSLAELQAMGRCCKLRCLHSVSPAVVHNLQTLMYETAQKGGTTEARTEVIQQALGLTSLCHAAIARVLRVQRQVVKRVQGERMRGDARAIHAHPGFEHGNTRRTPYNITSPELTADIEGHIELNTYPLAVLRCIHAGKNGWNSLHRSFQQDTRQTVPFETFRAVGLRYLDREGLKSLLRVHTDHNVCPAFGALAKNELRLRIRATAASAVEVLEALNLQLLVEDRLSETLCPA